MSTPQLLDDYLMELLQPASPAPASSLPMAPVPSVPDAADAVATGPADAALAATEDKSPDAAMPVPPLPAATVEVAEAAPIETDADTTTVAAVPEAARPAAVACAAAPAGPGEPATARTAAPVAAPPAAIATPSEPPQARPMPALPANLFSAPPPPQNRRAEERRTRWLLMRCAGQDYAVELLKVQEVVLPTVLLPLRGSAPAVLGVMNLRGQVVPVIDLAIYLHRPPRDDDTATRIVVLEEHGEPLGMRVSAVAEVVDISARQIEPSDHIQTGRTATGLFHGVARIGKSTVILLDATQLMQ